MITIVFLAFLLLSMTVALTDWRRGWLMAVLCGVLQDPVRKLTPGAPVVLTLSVILVYMVILFASSGVLQQRRGRPPLAAEAAAVRGEVAAADLQGRRGRHGV